MQLSSSIQIRLLTFLFLLCAFIILVLLTRSGGTSSNDGGTTVAVRGGTRISKNDPFAVPFCDSNGTCHERPDQPSPRTVYSAWTKKQYDEWWEFHKVLNARAQEYAKKEHFQKQKLILLGDSITESWIGTGLGKELPSRFDGIPNVLKERFPQNVYDPLVLAISGDQTQHLLYRLQNGQLLPQYGYASDANALFVVLIGTNNLGSGELPGPSSQGVLAVAKYLLKNTKGSIKVLQLLPRGDTFRLPKICPPRCTKKDGLTPFKSFLPAIDKVNQVLRDSESMLQKEFGTHRIQVLDCGEPFLQQDGDVNSTLMPDLLHPNAQGQELLADCILKSFPPSLDNKNHRP